MKRAEFEDGVLTYGDMSFSAFEDKGSQRDIVINTSAGTQNVRLDFRPNESLMLKVNDKGKVEFVDLEFTAKKIDSPQNAR